ncbi:MAG: RNA methyltransferase [Clostridiales bacterium]|jgi:TrmH family RNA methyltransferase|nr:RNA methyltransferase [Clostridiales bacterium]
MEVITSADNKKIKRIASLREKKYRDEYREYVAEGKRWVLSAAKSGSMSDIVREIVVTDALYGSVFAELAGVAAPVTVVSERVYEKLSDTPSPQGILAVLAVPEQKESVDCRYSLLLDRVRDPGNMGAIIRTACAAGYNDIVCDGCADVYNPKVVRSSMGALPYVNIIDVSPRILGRMREDGYAFICADMGGGDVFRYKPRPKRFCLIIGSEADGVSDSFKRAADDIVSIPMRDVESLNAAVSAGILMYYLKFSEGR